MRFPGIIPAVTTPFDADGEVDVDGLAANVRCLLDAGVARDRRHRHDGRGGQPRAAERRLVVETVVRGRRRRACR